MNNANNTSSESLYTTWKALCVAYYAAVDAMCAAIDALDADADAVEGCALDLARQAAVDECNRIEAEMDAALRAYRAASRAEIHESLAHCSLGNGL